MSGDGEHINKSRRIFTKGSFSFHGSDSTMSDTYVDREHINTRRRKCNVRYIRGKINTHTHTHTHNLYIHTYIYTHIHVTIDLERPSFRRRSAGRYGRKRVQLQPPHA